MKKNTGKKVIQINDTTSIEVPAEKLTLHELIRIQSEVILRMSEASMKQAEIMGKLVDAMLMEYEAQNPEFKMQQMIQAQNDNRLLN